MSVRLFSLRFLSRLCGGEGYDYINFGAIGFLSRLCGGEG